MKFNPLIGLFFVLLSYTSLPFQNTPVPKSSEFKVDSFQFDDFSLEPDQMLQASLRMFIDCGFIDEFHIDYEVSKGSANRIQVIDCFIKKENTL